MSGGKDTQYCSFQNMICLSSPPVITLLHCSLIHMDITAPGEKKAQTSKSECK